MVVDFLDESVKPREPGNSRRQGATINVTIKLDQSTTLGYLPTVSAPGRQCDLSKDAKTILHSDHSLIHHCMNH